MKKIINIGVLGSAKIAENKLIPTIQNLPDFYQLIGVASRRSDRANIFANQFNTTPFFDYDCLLNHHGLDAVYIPLPNALHYEWVKKALEKGLHVLVEKSLACSFYEVLELNQIAQKNKLSLIENFQFRFHAQLQQIKTMVNSDKIGELRCVKSSFGFPPFPDKDNIRYQKQLGGGALLDAGAYTLKVSQMFLGNHVFVDSASLFYDDHIGVDLWGSAYIKQKTGKLTSQVAFGFDHFYQCNIELWGSKGKLYSNRLFTSPSTYKPTIELETAEGKVVITLESDDHFKNMLLHFHHTILHKSARDSEYKQNINQSRLIEELRNKANENE